jgi:AcrR family transcriptional regulator
MATAPVKAPDSRQRFIDVAIRLFTRHSFAGTSLQMIADELGVTKSAVHHHFRSREELLTAVVEPLIGQLQATIEAAEALRGRHARAEHLLTGFVDLVVCNKSLMSVLSGDPSVIEILRMNPRLSGLAQRQIKLLADAEPGDGGRIKASVAINGIAGATRSNDPNVTDDTLRQHLLEAGRRTLGLRAPRRRH